MNTNDEWLEKEARYAWLRSQWAWHKRRINRPNGNWHKRQARFYLKGSHKVFTSSEMIFRAITKYSAALAANVTRNNALYRRLIAK